MKGNEQRIQSGAEHAGKPEVSKSAEIVYLKNFATYSAIPGAHLLREEFDRIKAAAEKPGARVNKTLAISAQMYAGEAGITLSDDSLILYSILCKDEDISSDLLRGDQQRLAEVLRMEGKAADATKLEKACIARNPSMKF